ncbi:hypothetical protein [Glaciimonas soli]|uniref:hypothetical protein n=1 Tax=Glaciimonas soli TaxID=2590999 RepID=UPI001D177D5E|nr:hypothetical protein [Glaciimonas soli]
MRKIDYQHLADILHAELKAANAILENDTRNAAALARKSCVTFISLSFAQRANVNQEIFLAACNGRTKM